MCPRATGSILVARPRQGCARAGVGNAAGRAGWVRSDSRRRLVPSPVPKSGCFKPAFWDVPKACFSLPLCFIWRAPGELVWMRFCKPARQKQTGGCCSPGFTKGTQHSPFGRLLLLMGWGLT